MYWDHFVWRRKDTNFLSGHCEPHGTASTFRETPTFWHLNRMAGSIDAKEPIFE